ncbi:MAG: F0F1 ATP synthase subunit A [Bacillota bacterium]|jgi:F-type H+-transporting ATPase subunit a
MENSAKVLYDTGINLFGLGNLQITSYMVTAFVVTVIFCILALLIRKKCTSTGTPGTFQNVVEWAVGSLYNFFGDVLGKDKIDTYFPFIATLFVFILTSNYIGLLPMAGEVPGFASPTSTLGFTAGLAIMTFVITHVSGFKFNGVRYLKHFVTPFAFMLPLLLLDELCKPLSLSLRLYGNVMGGETVIAQLFGMVPLLVPVIMQILELLLGFLQALVFATLTSVYISESSSSIH